MQPGNYKDYDFYFNFALVGPPSVGKSSIIERYVRGAFDTKTTSTVGYDFRIK
jgi:GTPase SAR1 family protein